MKNRVKALLLAAGLTLSMFGTSVYAEAVSTEVSTEAAAQTPSEDTQSAAASTGDTILDSVTSYVSQILQTLPSMTDEDLASLQESDAYKALSANWASVKDELGSVEAIEDQTAEYGEDGKSVVVTSKVKYSDVSEKTNVTVKTTLTFADSQFSSMSSLSATWDVKYSKSKLIGEAGLNTILGMGIVFIVLLFLSFLIGRIKVVNSFGQKKKEIPEIPEAPAPATVVEEEEEVTDDEELIAVIAAAIAASESTGTDGFVVRSIRKVNRR